MNNSLLVFLPSVPAWVIFYLLTAIALLRIWRLEYSDVRRQWLSAYIVQLLLSAVWLVLFFALGSLTVSMTVGIIFWFAFVVLTLTSYELDRKTFWLLIPCLAWITFAIVLNIITWWVN